MKKPMIVVGLLSLALNSSAEVIEDRTKVDAQAHKGPAIGVLAGGLLAGPPGMMVDFIGGALAAIYPESDVEGLGFDRYVVLSFLPGGEM